MPAGLSELSGQCSQEAAAVCAVSALYLPRAHSLQVPGPDDTLYWPAAQAAQLLLLLLLLAEEVPSTLPW